MESWLERPLCGLPAFLHSCLSLQDSVCGCIPAECKSPCCYREPPAPSSRHLPTASREPFQILGAKSQMLHSDREDMCPRVIMCMFKCVCTCACVCVEARGQLQVLFLLKTIHTLRLLRQTLFLGPAIRPEGFSCFHLPQCNHAVMSGFLHIVWG